MIESCWWGSTCLFLYVVVWSNILKIRLNRLFQPIESVYRLVWSRLHWTWFYRTVLGWKRVEPLPLWLVQPFYDIYLVDIFYFFIIHASSDSIVIEPWPKGLIDSIFGQVFKILIGMIDDRCKHIANYLFVWIVAHNKWQIQECCT